MQASISIYTDTKIIFDEIFVTIDNENDKINKYVLENKNDNFSLSINIKLEKIEDNYFLKLSGYKSIKLDKSGKYFFSFPFFPIRYHPLDSLEYGTGGYIYIEIPEKNNRK